MGGRRGGPMLALRDALIGTLEDRLSEERKATARLRQEGEALRCGLPTALGGKSLLCRGRRGFRRVLVRIRTHPPSRAFCRVI